MKGVRRMLRSMVSKAAKRWRRQWHDNFCDPIALMRWSIGSGGARILEQLRPAAGPKESNTVGLQTIWVIIYYNITLHFPAAVSEHCLRQHRQSLNFVTCLPLRHLNNAAAPVSDTWCCLARPLLPTTLICYASFLTLVDHVCEINRKWNWKLR